MKRNLTIVALIVIFVCVNAVLWMFYAANTAVVTVDLLGLGVIEVTVWKLTLSCFALGAVVVLLMAGFFGLRGGELRRRYRKTIRRLEGELHQLRSLPLSTDREPPVAAETAAGGDGPKAAAGGQG
ncbi:MAG: LapA family protein [bacterium]|nr:LapA family protein [bacterium]